VRHLVTPALFVLLGPFAFTAPCATSALATTVEIQSPCAPTLAASGPVQACGRSVGATTTHFLDARGIEYVGDDSGMVSILGTPYGDAALEILSDTAMRAYGWCYLVDGVEPDVMPDQLILTGDETAVTWFYAYSLYADGAWKEYCTPVHETLPPFICGGR
jgi:hypothetical protein